MAFAVRYFYIVKIRKTSLPGSYSAPANSSSLFRVFTSLLTSLICPTGTDAYFQNKTTETDKTIKAYVAVCASRKVYPKFFKFAGGFIKDRAPGKLNSYENDLACLVCHLEESFCYKKKFSLTRFAHL